MPSNYPQLWDPTQVFYEEVHTEVLVIGGGVAGFSASIAAAAEGAEVLCVTKDTATSSNTWWAQGGVAAVLGDEDSFESHCDDTLKTGRGLSQHEAVEVVVREGPQRIAELLEWGGAFDLDQDNRLDLTLEGGHSHKRIVHARGDQTGTEVQGTLIRKVRSLQNVTLWEHGFALDLLVEGDRCGGAIVCRNGVYVLIRAKAVVMATGGAGQLYRESTNPPIATADGLGMALRAGAGLRDLEFVQFHPTTLYVAGSARQLITEAVRGEGGLLRDMRGERFMVNYHPDAELAPRDVVCRAIVRHMKANGDSHVFIDITHFDPKFVEERFPRLSHICQIYNLDVTKDLIPIHPSVHYMMGGIEVDLEGRTQVQALFACGEVASSGLHGANRLASNSLLEGFVFGRRAGRAAANEPPLTRSLDLPPSPDFGLDGSVMNAGDMYNSIKSLMWRDVGIVRDESSLQSAVKRLEAWSAYVFQCAFHEQKGWELVNVLSAAAGVANSALRRRESRGAHFRSDYPETDDANFLCHSVYPSKDNSTHG
ncbi:MAG: L-aspartate oxidase [Planctomycetota bacterium]